MRTLPGVLNLGYILSFSSVRIFHTGDIDSSIADVAYMQAVGIPGEHVDLAFVAHFLLSTPSPLPVVTQGIQPRRVVAQHLQYTGEAVNYAQIQRNFPNAVLFRREGEVWTIQ